MDHPYFSDVNWDAYYNDTIKPPFVPSRDLNAASQHEIGSFNDKKLETIQLNAMDLELFEDWDYIRSASFLEEVVAFKRCEELYVSCCSFFLIIFIFYFIIHNFNEIYIIG